MAEAFTIEFRAQGCQECHYLGWFGLKRRCTHPEHNCFPIQCDLYQPWGRVGGPEPVKLGAYATEWFDAIARERIRALKEAAAREERREIRTEPGGFALEAA